MTTCVYVKGKCLAADRKTTGGIHRGPREGSKITSYQNENNALHIAAAGAHINKCDMDEAVRKLLDDEFGYQSIIHVSDLNFKEFKKFLVEAGYDFEIIIIVTSKLTKSHHAWFIGSDLTLEEVTESVGIGSGGSIAAGIMKAHPEIEMDKLFEAVSEIDPATGKTFDVINFNG